MSRQANWPKRVFRTAAIAALLCTFAFSETASPASSNPSKKPATHKNSAPSSTTAHKTSTAGKSKKSRTISRKGKHSKQSSRRGQQKIDNTRTVQIQEALIKQHYLSGEPSGKWDASTEEALRKLQADNGWQNKTVPDSRALIKLGLGPSHDHLLNPESAMTTSPSPQSPVKPASGPSEGTPSNQRN